MNQRLDFLMRLTNTSNTELGKITVFTPSYISRIRSGSRPLLANGDFLRRSCKHFILKISDSEQKLRLCQAMGISYLPTDPDLSMELLVNWLQDKSPSEFLDLPGKDFSLPSDYIPDEKIPVSRQQKGFSTEIEVYYGFTGLSEL